MASDRNDLLTDSAHVDPSLLMPLQDLRPRIWTVWVTLLVAIVLAFAGQIAVSLSVLAYLLSQGQSPSQIQVLVVDFLMTPPMFILMLFGGPGMFGLVALVAARFSPEPMRTRLGMIPVTCSRDIYPLAIIGSLFPAAVGIGLAEGLVWLVPQVPVDQSVVKLYEQMTPLWSVPFVILIGLIPGFCEEMLFRGYVQRRFVARWNPLWGIGLSSLLFGLAHVMPAVVLMATVIGVYLGVVAWKSGSIWPTICCHLFINSSINFWRVVIIFGEIPERTQSIVTWSVIAISAVAFAMSLRLLYRPRHEPTATT